MTKTSEISYGKLASEQIFERAKKRSMRREENEREREKAKELLYTKKMSVSEWQQEEEEGEIVYNEKRIVSKEALVLIKLAPAFFIAM